jgi:PAS domain-containing protein
MQPTLPEQSNAALACLALEDIFEFSPESILISDADGAIRDSTARAKELLRYVRDELVDMTVEALVRFRDSLSPHCENYCVDPRACAMGDAMNRAPQGPYGISRRHHTQAGEDARGVS